MFDCYRSGRGVVAFSVYMRLFSLPMDERGDAVLGKAKAEYLRYDIFILYGFHGFPSIFDDLCYINLFLYILGPG